MPTRSSSAQVSPRLWLLVSIVASLVGLTLVRVGLSDPLLRATAVEAFPPSRGSPTTALTGAPTVSLVAIPRGALREPSPRHAALELRWSRRALGMPPSRGFALGHADLTAWHRGQLPVPATTTETWRGEGRHPFDTALMTGGQGPHASPTPTAMQGDVRRYLRDAAAAPRYTQAGRGQGETQTDLWINAPASIGSTSPCDAAPVFPSAEE